MLTPLGSMVEVVQVVHRRDPRAGRRARGATHVVNLQAIATVRVFDRESNQANPSATTSAGIFLHMPGVGLNGPFTVLVASSTRGRAGQSVLLYFRRSTAERGHFPTIRSLARMAHSCSPMFG